jgi:hypothetical protein
MDLVRLKAFAREPLVHFLAIGAGLFLLFKWSGGPAGGAAGQIVISAGQIEYLASGFARTWQRPPLEDELKALIDESIRDEIASREAMAMGDTIIRRRLRQKLEFVAEAEEQPAPTDSDLEAWLRSHPESFRAEPQVAFQQVYLSPQRRGQAVEADARKLLARLVTAPTADAPALGDPLMIPDRFELSPRSEVVRVLGTAFADAVLQIEPGNWAGPIVSGYGLHLVFVNQRVPGKRPELAEVRPAVERELLANRRKEQLDAMYRRMLERYSVVVEKSAASARTASAQTAKTSAAGNP